jgi:hypothetical protein
LGFNRRRVGAQRRRVVSGLSHAKGGDRIKGDEQMLGDGQFVESVLKDAQGDLERKSRMQAGGYGFEWLVDRVAQQLEMD